MKDWKSFSLGAAIGVVLIFALGATLDPTIARFHAISLNQQTNILSMSGGFLTLDGVPIVSGASDNWSAAGTTNSTLTGIGYANEVVATNAITLNGDRRTAWPIADWATTYNFPGTVFNLIVTNIGTGETDIYTVPADNRMVPVALLTLSTNVTGFGVSVKTNGIYYSLVGLSTFAASQNSTATFPAFAFEPTETMAIKNGTTNAITVNLIGYLFPDTVPIRTYRNLALSNGDNLLYTVPVGKRAIAFPGSAGVRSPNIQVSIIYGNYTAGSRDPYFAIVPNGYSLEEKFFLHGTTTTSSNNFRSFGLQALFAGDSVYVRTDSSDTNQVAYITVQELTP